jgi:CRP-like cAMP-binding protein/sugar phosphate isomerase/epimerase
MYYVDKVVGNRSINKILVASLLEESLKERDTNNSGSLGGLQELGFKDEEALILLASHKSLVKYGYRLTHDTLSYIYELFHGNSRFASLRKLLRSPFFFAKTGWIYEHAPFFLLHDNPSRDETDSCILDFAQGYQANFLTNKPSFDPQERVTHPRRVLATTFWEKGIWDPVELVLWAARNNLEGLELNVDFHPFNYAKLLPEELSGEKRQEVREAAETLGIKLNIHSPVVGPYSPLPNKDKGTPLFYNPLDCMELHRETIFLASDIGAESVVVHLIDLSRIKELANLIMTAAGSTVRVTIENYCETRENQDASTFISALNAVCDLLPREVIRDNFGVTLDVGHLNIEGEDPLIGSEKIGKWCKDKGVFLRMHATDNYGKLLCAPPYYSADIHGNVSGKGINNSLIITLLRYLGLSPDVLAEQIQPLTPDDIAIIDQAQRVPIKRSYSAVLERGRKRLSSVKVDSLIEPGTKEMGAYQFLAGLEGIDSLREYLLYRKIQTKTFLSVDEARKSSLEFMKMPRDLKVELMGHIDDLLYPIQTETGLIERSKEDLISQNLSGGLFERVNQEHLNQIFHRTRTFRKGDIIFEQHSQGTEMYYIKQGEVTALVDGLALATLGVGEIFGEMSLYYDIKRTATIRVNKDHTQVGVLPREEFEDILAHHRKYAYGLIYRLFHILPQRLRNLNEKYKIAVVTLKRFGAHEMESVKRLEDIIAESQLVKDSLAGFSGDDIRELFTEMRRFAVDEEIFAEGDIGDGIYYIFEGKVRVLSLTSDLKEIVLGDLGAGHIFGEMALIDDTPRSASVIPLGPCEMGFMSRSQFEYLIQSKSDLAYSFMSCVCLTIFRHILRLNTMYLKVKREFH